MLFYNKEVRTNNAEFAVVLYMSVIFPKEIVRLRFYCCILQHTVSHINNNERG